MTIDRVVRPAPDLGTSFVGVGAPLAQADAGVGPPLNFKRMMDTAPVGGLQWLVAIILTWVQVIEGIDFQIAAYSAPAFMAAWHLTKPQTAPLLAAAMIGMAVGTLIGSWTGDRFGRKYTLVVSVAFFGAMTIVCATAPSPRTFIAYRFVSGLGLGAAFPVAAAMMREWMPRRAASKAIAIMTIGVPGGVVLGAMLGSFVLPAHGWRYFFVFVGLLCTLTAVALWALMPESPGYLILRGRYKEVHALLARAWKRSVGNGVEPFELETRRDGERGLFQSSNARVNIGLWTGFLFSSLATYTMAAWLTIILVDLKLPLASALRGPMLYSSSAIAGGLTVGWLIGRLGSRWAMLLLSSIAVVDAAALSVAAYMLPPGTELYRVFFPGLIFLGFCIGALIPSNLAVAAIAYDTRYRAQGIGVMYAIGRVGSIFASFIGGAVLAAASLSGFFAMLGIFVIVVMLGIVTINRHVERQRRLQ